MPGHRVPDRELSVAIGVPKTCLEYVGFRVARGKRVRFLALGGHRAAHRLQRDWT